MWPLRIVRRMGQWWLDKWVFLSCLMEKFRQAFLLYRILPIINISIHGIDLKRTCTHDLYVSQTFPQRCSYSLAFSAARSWRCSVVVWLVKGSKYPSNHALKQASYSSFNGVQSVESDEAIGILFFPRIRSPWPNWTGTRQKKLGCRP